VKPLRGLSRSGDELEPQEVKVSGIRDAQDQGRRRPPLRGVRVVSSWLQGRLRPRRPQPRRTPSAFPGRPLSAPRRYRRDATRLGVQQDAVEASTMTTRRRPRFIYQRTEKREATLRVASIDAESFLFSHMRKPNNIITREILILAIWFIEQKVIIFRCRTNIRDEPARL